MIHALDVFYELHFDEGVPFHVRTANLLDESKIIMKNDLGIKGPIQHTRLFDVKDEKVALEKALKLEACHNVAQDPTYDTFCHTYRDHIEKKVDAKARVAGRPETAPFNPLKPRAPPKTAREMQEDDEMAEFARLMKLKFPNNKAVRESY